MNDELKPIEKKFIMVGDSGVGKTNIIYRFVNGEFQHDLESTIGIDFSIKEYRLGDKTFSLHLYDTGGAEHYGALRQNYYYNADFAIIVYDITNRESFNSIDNWIRECECSHNENLIKILVGNKTDLIKEKREGQVTEQEGKDLADRYGMDFYETSALTGYHINKIFYDCCKKVNTNSLEDNNNEEDQLEGLSKFDGGKREELIVLNKEDENKRVDKKHCCCFHLF